MEVDTPQAAHSKMGQAPVARMPSSRLSARLGQLPHGVLAELTARLCLDGRLCLDSQRARLQAVAEECLAAHAPLSHELVERVLLSPDLVPSILGPLEAEDGATAAVCSQWLAGWKATNETPWRRRLKQVPLELPEEIDPSDELRMVGTPDGRLLVCGRDEVRMFDRSMRVMQTVACEFEGLLAASDDSIFYAANHAPIMRRSSHDGRVLAEYQLEGFYFYCPVLAPGGLLFCVAYNHNEEDDVGDNERDEIIALDAQTLQLRHRFGRGLLRDTSQMVVVGDELFVCDTDADCLHVFSFTGEHRRSVEGKWRSPRYLCFAKDRLYLVEAVYPGVIDGRRILVLSLQGDILQVITHPTEPKAVFEAYLNASPICCFNGKLLVSYCTEDNESEVLGDRGLLAFSGL